jgi:CubicO group peptidase (beta-lactamase class C family)
MLLLASGGRAVVAAPPSSSVTSTIKADVTAYLQKTGTPGAVVAVYDAHQYGASGSVMTFGVTSYQGKMKVSGDTVFQIGSITKVFSGTLYGVAMGKGYATPTTTAYKAFGSPASLAHATAFQKITMVQLATHTAGFPDEVDARAADPLFAGSSTIPNTMITFYNSFNAPTGCYKYSSAGFITLGYAIADSWPGSLHGKYPSIVDTEISKPLGLKCTNTSLSSACAALASTGVDVSKKPFKPAVHSATDMKSTGNDMLRWMEANLGVLTSTPQSLASAIATAQKPEGQFPNCSDKSKLVTVGLAWQEAPLPGAPGTPTALMKDGASGYGDETAMLVIVPSKKVGIAILTNGLPGAGGPDALAKSLAAKILTADAGGAAPAPAAASPKPRRKRHAQG